MPNGHAPAVDALIFMNGRNCRDYVERALESLARQTLQSIHILFIDDASTDDTAAEAEKQLAALFAGRHTLVRNTERFGKARNTVEHLIPRSGMATFVAVVDADDSLVENGILERMRGFYAEGKDVVWTNYKTDNGLRGANRALDPAISPRRQGWRTSHFFSFRAELLNTIPNSYFKQENGEWLQAACDIALALPVLDQTRRYQFIPVDAYLYTATNPQSHHNLDPDSIGFNSKIQQASAQTIFRKPPLPLIRPLVTASEPPAPPVAGPAAKPEAKAEAGPLPALPGQRSHAWSDITGARLAEAYPTLLDAIAFAGPHLLLPEQVWALKTILETGPADSHVLHIGATRTALALAAMTTGTERKMTCLSASPAERQDLAGRLGLIGAKDGTILLDAAPVPMTDGKVSGPFPDLGALGNGAAFDLVVIDLPPDATNGTASVSLPLIGPHLARRGFAFCLLAATPAAEKAAADYWQAITTGMTFCINAIGGSGLLVMAGRP